MLFLNYFVDQLKYPRIENPKTIGNRSKMQDNYLKNEYQQNDYTKIDS